MMTRSLFKSRTLLAAAAVASLATGCHSAGSRPPVAPAPTPTQTTFAAATAPAVVITPVASPVVVETVPVASPAPAAPAAEPMCDADGRPLAGNVRKGGSKKDECQLAQAGTQL
jgi:hypothetical protein